MEILDVTFVVSYYRISRLSCNARPVDSRLVQIQLFFGDKVKIIECKFAAYVVIGIVTNLCSSKNVQLIHRSGVSILRDLEKNRLLSQGGLT
jgi:hypothetical protein